MTLQHTAVITIIIYLPMQDLQIEPLGNLEIDLFPPEATKHSDAPEALCLSA